MNTRLLRLYFKVKGIGRSFARIQCYQSSYSTGLSAYFDLAAAALDSNYAYGSVLSGQQGFAYQLEDGWVKVGVKFTSAFDGPIEIRIQAASADGTDSYTGDPAKGLFVWDAALRDLT
ncbi:hypothetical protein I6F35_37790 [Bradyrhizobium sp. BRP22]|uniref:hypothetical protein n=1 Tax=Bradyrhizobium sp. BRP22 TaxID=2793821 RepID=UPI001CD714F8|nr:hypothetical protein [Bradyrhizobium sp. BRP22]MCA1458835.1 hypothetical protein [Bradyrhizobium sp. BRP22]